MTVINPCVVRRMKFKEVCVRLGPGGEKPGPQPPVMSCTVPPGAQRWRPGWPARRRPETWQTGRALCLSPCPMPRCWGWWKSGLEYVAFLFSQTLPTGELTWIPGKWQNRLLKKWCGERGCCFSIESWMVVWEEFHTKVIIFKCC